MTIEEAIENLENYGKLGAPGNNHMKWVAIVKKALGIKEDKEDKEDKMGEYSIFEERRLDCPCYGIDGTGCHINYSGECRIDQCPFIHWLR